MYSNLKKASKTIGKNINAIIISFDFMSLIWFGFIEMENPG